MNMLLTSDRLVEQIVPTMNPKLVTTALLFAVTVLAGCGESRQPKVRTRHALPAQQTSGEPQAKLQTLKLWVGADEIIAEIAHTERQVTNGMMFRTTMAENEGMLFVFPFPHRTAFWMKNTLLPLSCAYADSEGVILELHDLKPKDETLIRSASDQVQYVLETQQGWFERHNVGVGTLIRTERGSLAETFFPAK